MLFLLSLYAYPGYKDIEHLPFSVA